MPPPNRPKPPPPPPGAPTKPGAIPAQPARRGIRSAEIVIEDRTFTITTIDADAGFEISPTLLDYVTGPIVAAVMALAGVDQSAPTVLQALSDLTRKLREPEFRALIWRLLAGATVDGRELKDPHVYFASDYGVCTRLALFAIRENFGSFLDMFPPNRRAEIAGFVAHLVSQAENILSRPSSSSEGGPAPPTSETGSTSPT